MSLIIYPPFIWRVPAFMLIGRVEGCETSLGWTDQSFGYEHQFTISLEMGSWHAWEDANKKASHAGKVLLPCSCPAPALLLTCVGITYIIRRAMFPLTFMSILLMMIHEKNCHGQLQTSIDTCMGTGRGG